MVQETAAIRVKTPVCFDIGGISGTQRVMVAPVHQHAAPVLEFNRLQRSILHGWKRKGMGGAGSSPTWQGGELFFFPAALKTAPPDGEFKGNLRGKRSDPSFRANVPSSAAAVPETNGSDANAFAGVSGPSWASVPPAGGHRTQPRGLTQQSRAGNRRDGPAARPNTPLAVENSVGKLAAHLRVARRMPATGKERVANAHPHFFNKTPQASACGVFLLPTWW
jgi:hypothetical protein